MDLWSGYFVERIFFGAVSMGTSDSFPPNKALWLYIFRAISLLCPNRKGCISGCF